MHGSGIITRRIAGDLERCEEEDLVSAISAISVASKGRGTMRVVSSSEETGPDERATSLRKRSGQGEVKIMP